MDGIIKPRGGVYIISAASGAGEHERRGPIGTVFDVYDDTGTDRFGQKSWEEAECRMLSLTISAALGKAKLTDSDIGAFLGGDLINQCTVTARAAVGLGAPFAGLFGACSTAAESILLGSILIDGKSGTDGRCVAAASSHNCSAERQFRYPVEYGGQRPPTAQWTVTGAGAFVLSAQPAGCDDILVEAGMFGRAIDAGIKDATDMGSAMAPATVDTLERWFEATSTKPSDYSMILTGDLGAVGSEILINLMYSQGYKLENHSDCGLIIYDHQAEDKHSGGSGCGCSAAVLASHIFPLMRSGLLRDVLFVGTGALMSPLSVAQGEAIPGIAHLVHLKSCAERK